MNKPQWITDKKQIKSASFESLKLALITSDGSGKDIKNECLKELMHRCFSSADEDIHNFLNQIPDEKFTLKHPLEIGLYAVRHPSKITRLYILTEKGKKFFDYFGYPDFKGNDPLYYKIAP